MVISLVLGSLAAGQRNFKYQLFAALQTLTFLALNLLCQTEQEWGGLSEALQLKNAALVGLYPKL